jgi:predicted naringenin-chalcone synthase
MKAGVGSRHQGKTKPHIASLAVASPPFSVDQAAAEEFLTGNFSGILSRRNLSVMSKILSHPSIRRRHFAFSEPDCLLREDPDSRIARFTEWATRLSSEAARKALADAGARVEDVSALIVNTCTGYVCPGISTYLLEELGMRRDIRAFDLVGSGCGGAVPNLQVAGAQLDGDDKSVVLSVSVEICSSTFDMDDDLSPVISNSIFSDGTVAAVLRSRPGGFELVSSSSICLPEYRDSLRYIHKNGSLCNQISTRLPHIVKKAVAHVVSDLLAPLSLKAAGIRHWALHAGGEKIIKEIGKELGLADSQLAPTRDILLNYGNMSSPTVWFVLKKIWDEGVAEGEWCIMVAFGAGLSAHAMLLRKT